MTTAARPLRAAPPSRDSRAVSASTVTMVILVLVTIVGLVGGGGGAFPLFFVAAAVTAALVAYYRDPARYVVFVFAMWFFTPWVRRVVDLHHGFQPANFVLAAPVLVSMVALLTAFRRSRELRGAMLYPFIFTVAGVAYGYFIGILKAGIFPATYGLITWLGPISFSVHLILSWRQFPALRDAFLTFLVWAMPVVAGYGIYQVAFLPQWDRYWMLKAEVLSIGAALPFAFRAFGTMNAPGPYSVALLIGILFLLGSARRGMMLGMALALVAILLTRTRSAWVALLVGILVVQFMGPVRRMARNWAFLLFLVVLAVPVLSLDVFRETIFTRFASFASLSEDNSFQARLQISNATSQMIGARAEGEGLGSIGGGGKLGSASGRQASVDNGFLEIFFLMGWPGGSLIIMGLIGQLLTLARFRDSRVDAFANSARACVWALLSVLLIGDIFSGAVGAMFWGAYGFACCAHAYNFASGKGLRSRQLVREFSLRPPARLPG